MNFAQRLKETLQTGLDIGFKAGVQRAAIYGWRRLRRRASALNA